MTKEKSNKNIVKKFIDPIIDFNLITLLIAIILIICLFSQPILSKIDLIADTIIKIYWNGFFKEIDIPSGDVLSSGYLADFPLSGIWLNISSLIFLIIISIIQLTIIFIKKGITRTKFLSFIIWLEFLYSVLAISGYFDTVNWKILHIEDDILIFLRGHLIFNLIFAVLVLLLILILTAFITESNKEKIIQTKNMN